MLARPTNNGNFVTTLEFILIDNTQHQRSSPSTSQQLEIRASAIAHNFCLKLANLPKQITIHLLRDVTMSIFGIRYSIEIITEQNLSEEKQKLETQILSAIESGAALANKDNIFNFEPCTSLSISSVPNDFISCKYKGKVAKRLYDYNKLNKTEVIKIEYIDEGKVSLLNRPHTKKMDYDRWSNITSISYEYTAQPIADKDQIEKMEKEATTLVVANKKLLPFLTAIQNKDYNLAFRRACAIGATYLVKFLFKYNNNGQFTLDLNEMSLSNLKTPLDYAISAGCEEIVAVLQNNGAKTFETMQLSFVDAERQEIQKSNPAKPQSRKSFFDSEDSIFSDPLERVEELNRKNQERFKKEREEKMSSIFMRVDPDIELARLGIHRPNPFDLMPSPSLLPESSLRREPNQRFFSRPTLSQPLSALFDPTTRFGQSQQDRSDPLLQPSRVPLDVSREFGQHERDTFGFTPKPSRSFLNEERDFPRPYQGIPDPVTNSLINRSRQNKSTSHDTSDGFGHYQKKPF